MDEKLRLATEKWSLTDLAEVYRRPTKVVCSAESKIFGSVILKIADDLDLLRSEHAALVRFAEASARSASAASARAADSAASSAAQLDATPSAAVPASCAVRAYDDPNGLLLLERITPGTVLRDEPSLEARLAAFKSVFDRIHTPQATGESYLDWLDAVARFFAEHQTDPHLAENVQKACQICADLFAKYPDRVLLHGDLHHDNLLRRADDTYAVIDPKGVVGPRILDLPRFIMNEIDTPQTEGFYVPITEPHSDPTAAIDPTCRAHMATVVHRMSELFAYPLADVARAYFMEVILGNAWCAKDGEPVYAPEIAVAASILDELT